MNIQNHAWYSIYRKAYFKAFIDAVAIIQRSEQNLRPQKMYNCNIIKEILKFCVNNIDDVIELGDNIEFGVLVKNEKKGKKTIKTIEIIRTDSEEYKRFDECKRKELSRPYSLLSVMAEARYLKGLYGKAHVYNHVESWVYYFYDLYKGKPLEPEAQEYFDKICKKNGLIE